RSRGGQGDAISARALDGAARPGRTTAGDGEAAEGTGSVEHDAVDGSAGRGACTDAAEIQSARANGRIGDVDGGGRGGACNIGRIAGTDGAAAGGCESRVGTGVETQGTTEIDRRTRVA